MTFGEMLSIAFIGAAGLGMLYISLRIVIEVVNERDEHEPILKDFFRSPLRALTGLCLVLGTTGFMVMIPLAMLGYEPELFNTGWRIWSICMIAMIASACLLAVL